jgi:hypothetical protein
MPIEVSLQHEARGQVWPSMIESTMRFFGNENSFQHSGSQRRCHMRTFVRGGNNAVWMSSQTKLSNVRKQLGLIPQLARFENPDVPNP